MVERGFGRFRDAYASPSNLNHVACRLVRIGLGFGTRSPVVFGIMVNERRLSGQDSNCWGPEGTFGLNNHDLMSERNFTIEECTVFP